MLGLSEEQKACVREMGLGEVLNMKLIDVPGALTYYILEKFNPKTMKIHLPCGTIDVTRESVANIMGFPMGNIKISDIPVSVQNRLKYIKWTEQFSDKDKIQLKEIKAKLLQTTNADVNFMMNIIVLMINSLIDSSTKGKCNYKQMKYINENTDLRDIDWCSMLIESLVK